MRSLFLDVRQTAEALPPDSVLPAASVVFFYPYAGARRDAVGSVINQMADEISSRSVGVTVLSLPNWPSTGWATRLRLFRAFEQVYFLFACALWLVLRYRTAHVVVTVDAPSGVGFLGRIGQALGGRHVAWVMDLYRIRECLDDVHNPVSGGSKRSKFEIASLKSANVIVTIGCCMKDVLSNFLPNEVRVITLWGDPELTARSEVYKDDAMSDAKKPLRLLYSGSARSIHPLRGLVDAIELLNGSVTLTLAGTGDEIENAARIATERKISSIQRVEPVPKSKLFEFYQEFDAQIVSLSPDATGTCVPSKTYSSLVSGLPVFYLGDRAGQAARDVIASNSGVVLSPYNASEIQAALTFYSTRRSVLTQMGRDGRDFVRAKRNLTTSARCFADLCLSGSFSQRQGRHV